MSCLGSYVTKPVFGYCFSQRCYSCIFYVLLYSYIFYIFFRCGPCKFIAPIFEQMASDAGDKAIFVKVDVDNADDVAAACGIRAMPTFHLYKGGAKVGELMGADANQLKELVAKHM